MADEFEQQLERIEHAVAEIAAAVQGLRDDRAAAGRPPPVISTTG